MGAKLRWGGRGIIWFNIYLLAARSNDRSTQLILFLFYRHSTSQCTDFFYRFVKRSIWNLTLNLFPRLIGPGRQPPTLVSSQVNHFLFVPSAPEYGPAPEAPELRFWTGSNRSRLSRKKTGSILIRLHLPNRLCFNVKKWKRTISCYYKKSFVDLYPNRAVFPLDFPFFSGTYKKYNCGGKDSLFAGLRFIMGLFFSLTGGGGKGNGKYLSLKICTAFYCLPKGGGGRYGCWKTKSSKSRKNVLIY